MEHLLQLFSSNQFFSGGFALTVFGSIIAFIYKIPGFLWPILKRTFVTQIEFSNDDPSYQWVLAWLSKQAYLQKTKHVRVLSEPETNSDDSSLRPLFSIPAGFHWFRYKKQWIWVSFTKTRVVGSKTPAFSEELSISTIFSGKGFIESLVEEARMIFEKRDSSQLSIFILDAWGENWKKLSSKPVRPLSSLVYDHDKGNEILQDLLKFTASRSWYNDMGIPWRRGYLFYGVPGGGKTTLIMALASETQKDIYILNLSKPDLSDDGLLRLMNNVPQGAFLVIEEVDCLFDGREVKNDKQMLTFSGLLTALDGITSAEGRILFMTTNNFSKLDPALVRPGRADVHVEFSNASTSQAVMLFQRFFNTLDKEVVRTKVLEALPEGSVSIAFLQELLVSHNNDFQAAIDALKGLDA